jgi:hypothetical protein
MRGRSTGETSGSEHTDQGLDLDAVSGPPAIANRPRRDGQHIDGATCRVGSRSSKGDPRPSQPERSVMNITMKTLSALTIATAALAATAMPSSAIPAGAFNGGSYHAPNQPPTQAQPTMPSAAAKIRQPGNFKCLMCEIPRPHPVGPPVPGGWDHDHDHDHDHGHGWNRWHGWRGGLEIVVEAPPETTIVTAPAPSVPVWVSAPARQVAASPCNCLTKQSLPDGSVLFQDICTKESAIAVPQAVGAR